MPAFTAHAPGKAILFGEHAVVYARPAIAVPVHQVQARATVLADPMAPEGRVIIDAPDVDLQSELADLADTHPFQILVHTLLKTLHQERLPALRLKIKSDIPVAAGLGSGAAVSVAALRALAAFLGRPLNDGQVCDLAYEVEKAYHGNPSGIDNTVITYACPIYFQRGKPFELIHPARPITLVIGDSGIASPTSIAVGGVRQRWEENPSHYEALFDNISSLADAARAAIEAGQIEELGPIMNANQRALEKIGVSIPELDRLIQRALNAGALGAKLSGAGLGGNMIALAPTGQAEEIARALSEAGATRVIITTIPANPF